MPVNTSINEKFYFKLNCIINNPNLVTPLKLERVMETIIYYGKNSSALSIFSIESKGYPIYRSKNMSLPINDLVRLNVISNMFNSVDIKERFNIERFDIIVEHDFFKISKEELDILGVSDNKDNFQDNEYKEWQTKNNLKIESWVSNLYTDVINPCRIVKFYLIDGSTKSFKISIQKNEQLTMNF